MLDSKTFRLIERFTRQELAEHPVWQHYEDDRDRKTILGWGVSPELLDAELAKFQFCGPEPLCPVLAFDPLPEVPNLNIGVEFEAADGTRLPGYLIDPHAFGVFVGERELCFNRSLGAAAGRQAEALARELTTEPSALFPLRYRAAMRMADGRPVAGEIAAFW